MDAFSVWTIYAQADGQELDALMECVAQRLNIPKPDSSGTEVIFQADPDRVGEALEECDPEWARKALLAPPDRR